MRRRVLTHRRLRKRMARRLSYQLLKILAREGMAAGCDALSQPPTGLETAYFLASSNRSLLARFLERHVLDPNGLPAPYPQWIEAARKNTTYPCPPVTVAICTRDRPDALVGCIECLKQLDYPSLEILVVNNSVDPLPTQTICENAGVTYVRVAKAGLSRARNAALAAAA